MKQRIDFLDGVKGFGILSIVAGHVFIPGWNDVIFLYHLPIFFLLAGYFTNTKRSLGVFTKQKARRLLVPYTVTALLIVLFSIPKSFAEHTPVLSGLQKWGLAAVSGVGVEPTVPLHMESIGAIWFLWALFWGSLLLRALIAPKQKWFRFVRPVLVGGLFAAGAVSTRYLFLPLSLQPALCALLWMYVGWLVKQAEPWLLQEKFKPYRGAALGAVYLFAWSLFLEAVFHYKPFLMVSAVFDGGLLGVAGSFAGSYIVYVTVWFLYRWKDRATKPLCFALSWMGKNSLLLLCMHIIEQDLIPWKQYYSAAGLEGTPFYAAVLCSKLAFVLIAGIIVSHIPGVRTLFLPKPKKELSFMNEFFISDGDVRLHCKLDRPEGLEKSPLCIVLHGLTGNMEEPQITGVAKAMNEVGVATLRVELYGHGQSGGKFEDHDVEKWIHNVLEVLDYVKNRSFVTDIYLCGHSQGGLTALMVAGKKPERIAKLILLAPALIIPNLAKRFAPEDLPDHMDFHGHRVSNGYMLAAQRLDTDAAITAYKGPVLVVQGTADGTVIPQDSIDAADAYENATLALIDGDSHCFDYHLDEVLAAVKTFLSNIQGANHEE